MQHTPNPDVLIDMEHMDDAGVFRLADELALVQTVDMFPPPVQDPVSYGRIVAANSMSDIWAMGGEPRTALNLLCYPPGNIPQDVIDDILRGGFEKMQEAGVALMGGHTQQNETICYGLSVTGLVHPTRILANNGARPGDNLVLTKPLGSGVLTLAMKEEGGLPKAIAMPLVTTMERLNSYACQAALQFQVHAMTDITGYGLLGHAMEMAKASAVQLHFTAEAVPLLPGVRERVSRFLSAGSECNRKEVDGVCTWAPAVGEDTRNLLCDAQTSGGLLIAIAPDATPHLLAALNEGGDAAEHIGHVAPLPADAPGHILSVV